MGSIHARLFTRPPKLEPTPAFYPSPSVGEGSVIGARCRLHSGATVGRNCRLGDDVVLYPHAVLYDNTVLGDRVILHAHAVDRRRRIRLSDA